VSLAVYAYGEGKQNEKLAYWVSKDAVEHEGQYSEFACNEYIYAVHTTLTDNGIQFTHRKKDKYAFEPLAEFFVNRTLSIG
jgi:hypothetical protein